MLNEGTRITKGASVAVVDDVRQSAETVAGIVEEADLEPYIISEGDGPFPGNGSTPRTN